MFLKGASLSPEGANRDPSGTPHPKICHLGAIKGAVTQTQLPGLPEGTETPLQLLQGQMGGSGMDNVGDTMKRM